MMNWTSSPHLLPYLIFGAAWAFVCGVVIGSVPAHGQASASPNITLEAPEFSAPGLTAP